MAAVTKWTLLGRFAHAQENTARFYAIKTNGHKFWLAFFELGVKIFVTSIAKWLTFTSTTRTPSVFFAFFEFDFDWLQIGWFALCTVCLCNLNLISLFISREENKKTQVK
jgi:hypothetical protein